MSWFKKETKPLETPKPKACTTCKCLIEVGMEQIVKSYGNGGYEFPYCHKCRPGYTYISFDVYGNSRYYKEITVEVDKDGNEVKKC